MATVASLALPGMAQKNTARRAHPAKAVVVQQQAQPVPPLPPPPLRPDQLPPNAPQVSYLNSQLTIIANNSTLADILRMVRARTGAQLDIPPATASERVVTRLGPGDAREVLSQLLSGSRFDYVLLGSDSDPRAVTQVILTPREAAAGTMANAGPGGGSPTASGPTPAPMYRPPTPQMPPDEDSDSEPEPTPAQVEQPPPAQPPAGQPPLGLPQPGQTPPQGTGAVPNQPNPNQVRTPEELLQELQRMQREEQNRQGQQPPSRPPQ